MGNSILTDDSVGMVVAREIGKRIQHHNVEIQEASLGGLELLDPMTGFDRVILIDAMALADCEIGTVAKVNPDDLPGGSAMARHQVSLNEALALGRHLKMDLPEEIIIYGIKVKDTTTFGETCTPEVENCIPQIVDQIIMNEFRCYLK